MPAWLAFSVIRLLEEHFPPAGLLRVHRPAWRTSSTTSPAAARTATPSSASSTSAPTTVEGLHAAGQRARRHRRQGAGDLPDRRRRQRHRAAGRQATAPTSRARTTTGKPAGKRANVPEDLPPDELTLGEGARSCSPTRPARRSSSACTPRPGCRWWPRTAASAPTSPSCCPRTRPSRRKPRTGSLFKSMTLDTVTLEDAVKLLSLPRVVGADAEGVEITAQNGRYGPYLKKGTDSRSLDVRGAAAHASPSTRRWRSTPSPSSAAGRAAAPPLKELGNDPVSGQPVVVKAGRFGEYVTDGEYNATLRKDDSVEAITLERAAELLAERRAKGPAKKTAKKGAKKTAGQEDRARRRRQEATAKKTTKKAAAKKS